MLRNETAPNERTALIVVFVVMVALWRLISFIESGVGWLKPGPIETLLIDVAMEFFYGVSFSLAGKLLDGS